jgi:DNA-binding XRE family transcriptional regulator
MSNLAEAELYATERYTKGEPPSTGAAERRRKETLARLAEEAREERDRLVRVLERCRSGATVRELWVKLGAHGDVSHVQRRLGELEDERRAHELDGRWHWGPGEVPARSLVTAATPAPVVLQDSVMNRPAPLPPRSGARRAATVASKEVRVVEPSTVPRDPRSSKDPGATAGRALSAERQGGEASPELVRRTDPATSCLAGEVPAAEDLETRSSAGPEVPTGRGVETAAAPSGISEGPFVEGALFPSQSAPWAPSREGRADAEHHGDLRGAGGEGTAGAARAGAGDGGLPVGEDEGVSAGDGGHEPNPAPGSGEAPPEGAGAVEVAPDLRGRVLEVLAAGPAGLRLHEIVRAVLGSLVSAQSNSYRVVQRHVIRLVSEDRVEVVSRGSQSLYLPRQSEVRTTLRSWCRHHRHRLGLSQRELARRAKVPVSAVGAIEAGLILTSSHLAALIRQLGPYDPSEALPLPAAPVAREPRAEGGGRLAAGSSSTLPGEVPAGALQEGLELQALAPGSPGLPSGWTGAEPAARGSGEGSGEGPSHAGDEIPPDPSVGRNRLGEGGASLLSALRAARAALDLAIQGLERSAAEVLELRERCAVAEGECERLRGRLPAARRELEGP